MSCSLARTSGAAVIEAQVAQRRTTVDDVVTISQVESCVRELPHVTEGTRYRQRTWFTNGKPFVWIRPFSKADLSRFAPGTAPTGPIVAIATDTLEDKEAILASTPPWCFSIAHFDGYCAFLVDLDAADLESVVDLIVEAHEAAGARTANG